MSDPTVSDHRPDMPGSSTGRGGDLPPIGIDPTAQPAEALRQKQAKRNHWAKISGYVVVVLALLRLGIYLLPSAPRACDAGEAKSAVVDAMNERYKADKRSFTLTGLSNIITVATGDKMNRCKAVGTFSDSSDANVIYNVTGDAVEASVTDDVPTKR